MSEDGRGRDEEAVRRFVERFAAHLAEAGMPRMPARVFATLLATDTGRLTATELADTLQVSPAAISGAVRYLVQVDMAGREREPGSRRDHYRVQDHWYELVGRRDGVLLRLENSMQEGTRALPPGSPAGDRLARCIDFFEFLRREMPKLLDRWRAERAAGEPPAGR